MLQHSAGTQAVLQERAGELIRGQGGADRLPGMGDHGQPTHAVVRQSGNVQHVAPQQRDRRAVRGDAVPHLSFLADRRHPLGFDRDDRLGTAVAAADDLRIPVAPQQRVRHEGGPERE